MDIVEYNNSNKAKVWDFPGFIVFSQLISTREWWDESTVNKFLPEPDRIATNPHNPTQTMRLYLLQKVFKIENTYNFYEWCLDRCKSISPQMYYHAKRKLKDQLYKSFGMNQRLLEKKLKNINLDQMSYETYQLFMKSNDWKQITRFVLNRDQHKCRLCDGEAVMVQGIPLPHGRKTDKLFALCEICCQKVNFQDGKPLKFKDACDKLQQLLKQSYNPTTTEMIGLSKGQRRAIRTKPKLKKILTAVDIDAISDGRG